MSTFVEIFRFELAHRVRHWSIWLYFAVMAGTVWLLLIDLMIGESAGNSAVHANAPATVAMAMTIGTMVMLIATAGLFGEAAARDVESRMHSLLYAMPLSKRGYLAGRFFGAFTLNALLLLAGTIGLLFVEAERGGGTASFGAFRPMAYAGASSWSRCRRCSRPAQSCSHAPHSPAGPSPPTAPRLSSSSGRTSGVPSWGRRPAQGSSARSSSRSPSRRWGS